MRLRFRESCVSPPWRCGFTSPFARQFASTLAQSCSINLGTLQTPRGLDDIGPLRGVFKQARLGFVQVGAPWVGDKARYIIDKKSSTVSCQPSRFNYRFSNFRLGVQVILLKNAGPESARADGGRICLQKAVLGCSKFMSVPPGAWWRSSPWGSVGSIRSGQCTCSL